MSDTARAKPRASLPVWVALLGSGVGGVFATTQVRINGGLAQQLGDGYVAAALSFGSGMLLLVVAALLSRRARTGFRLLRGELRAGRLPVWALLGGLGGALFVLTQGLVATVLGLALFTVGIVAGQVTGGLVLDRAGLGPGGRIRPSPQRLLGTGLAILAIVVSVWADLSTGVPVWLFVVPVVVGAAVSLQSAVNGLVRAAARSAVTATLVNFLVGTTVLVVAAVVSVALNGWPEHWPTSPVFYSGGLIGAVFIAIATMLVRTAGVLLLSMSNVAGQLIASVAYDLALPLAGGLTVTLVVGAAIGLVAVTVAALPGRAPRGEAGGA